VNTGLEELNRLKAFLQKEGYSPQGAIELMACLIAMISRSNNIPPLELVEDIKSTIMDYHESEHGTGTQPPKPLPTH